MKKRFWVGIIPGYEDLILGRIEESKKVYSREMQRTELLIRNPKFKLEFLQFSEHKWDSRPGPLPPNARVAFRPDRFGEDVRRHFYNVNKSRFCERWGLSREWDGSVSNIAEHVKLITLLYDLIMLGGDDCKSGVFWKEMAEYPDKDDTEYLFIKIEPWTTTDDIKSIWPRIEKLKRRIFGYADKGKWNFGQALCWYDLNKREKWSYLKIARLWIQEIAPHIEDEESFKVTIREGIKRIERYIKRLTPSTEAKYRMDIEAKCRTDI